MLGEVVSLRSFFLNLFAVFCLSLATGVVCAQTSLEWENSFEQSQVLTFFNPDLIHGDQYLKSESERIAAYFVENSKDLPALLHQLGLELTDIRRRHPALAQHEFHRRLKPFIESLNEEIDKKNDSVNDLRLQVTGYSAAALSILALGVDFLFLKKLKKRDPLKKKMKRSVCVGLVGCSCGALLGFSGAQMIGEKIPLVSDRESQSALAPPDEKKDLGVISSFTP